MHNLKYPIGEFEIPDEITSNMVRKAIDEIKLFPVELIHVAKDLTTEQLDTPYRPGGWTVRQVIHHCADSHINAIIRIKLALTEDNPIIKPYEQDKWVRLMDVQYSPIQSSLFILDGIHERLGHLLESLSQDQLEKTFIHPDHDHTFTVQLAILNYAWHGKHHLAHITSLMNRKKW